MTSTAASQTPQITQPLRDLVAWTNHFRAAEIPVLARTAEALEGLRANEDDVDANIIGEAIAQDPLMTLKVLAHAAANRSRRVVTDAETVTSALVMMGISPFFAAFGPQPTVEDRLADEPEALAGLSDTLRRAHRGANFALGFAVHRMDHDAAVIHAAALLHDFAEMLLWCHAPSLALRIREAQRADSTLRSSAAQLEVLNVELADLQQSLMKAWRLPELLIRISDDRHADSPTVRSVTLALRLARHTSQDWDNAAIPDDVKDIADLLNLSQAATLQLVRGI
jgi:HD-like signal output (HDOD) protein